MGDASAAEMHLRTSDSLCFLPPLHPPHSAYHKPLFMFLLTEAAARAAQLLLLLMGFRPGRQGRFTYWHVRPLSSSSGPAGMAHNDAPLSPLSPQPLSPPAPRGRSAHPDLRRRSTAGEAVGAALHHAADAVHHAAEHALDDLVAVTSSAAAAVAAQHPHGPSPLSPRALSPLSPRAASSLAQRSPPAELPARLASAPPAVPAVPAEADPPAAAEGGTVPRRRMKGDSAAEFVAAASGSLGAAASAAATTAGAAAVAAEPGAEAAALGALMPEPPASPFLSLAVQLPSDSAAALGGSGLSGHSGHSMRPDVPIVFLHGVGFGTLPYLALIRDIQHACPDTPVLMLEVRACCLASVQQLACCGTIGRRSPLHF